MEKATIQSHLTLGRHLNRQNRLDELAITIRFDTRVKEVGSHYGNLLEDLIAVAAGQSCMNDYLRSTGPLGSPQRW